MAKRFSDTNKWKKPFIRSLPAELKLFWFYILDDCDHAGIWDVDIEVASIRIGFEIDEKKALLIFGERIVVIGTNKWFIPDFISFQYGELNPTNRVHKSVIDLLNKYNKGLVSSLQGAKDKYKDKDKEKDKETNDQEISKHEFIRSNEIQKPDDNNYDLDLPEVTIGAAIQMFKYQKKQDVDKETILGLWDVFKKKNFTGQKFYNYTKDIFTHFINDLRYQKISDGTKPTTSADKQSAIRKRIIQEGQALYAAAYPQGNDQP
jgi:hypothetical protein